MKKPVLERDLEDIANIESLEDAKVILSEMLMVIKHLMAKLGTDSSNSSKPSSQDGYKKPDPKSQRGKSGRKSGGQKGHKGQTRNSEKKVDVTISMKGESPTMNSEMQVVDLEWKVKTTAYQFGNEFGLPLDVLPAYVKSRTQYGPNVKALAVYLLDEGAMSCERVVQCFSEVFGLSLSVGTCKNTEELLADLLTPRMEYQKKKCLGEDLLHADETGARCDGGNYRIHTVATEYISLYFAHKKRGKAAIIDQDVLNRYNGVLVRDHWCGYNVCTAAKDAYCNAHHLRELQWLIDHEKEGKERAQLMQSYLRKCKKIVERYECEDYDSIPIQEYHDLFSEYMSILLMGLAGYSVLERTGKRGRPKQQKGKNLLDRLRKHAEGVLFFMRDFDVPFDNNLAERAIRMIKTKMKVIGCFRSEKGIQNYCIIRSYIKTVRQRGLSVFGCLREVFELREKLVIL